MNMRDLAIRIEGLGKRYLIGGPQQRYDTLGEQLVSSLTSPLRRAGRLLRGQVSGAAGMDQTIWALRDVSLEIHQGETVGIIGLNGAGKSTLLKILSRITEPTEGRAELWGRVGSLLEVGTGFHPELTGRENVYLNGALLGMKGKEIQRKLDEIVAFAEIDQFLDTPVKYYSSGMYVRLAFSVAAHLEPEILLIDEVLAVGDLAFQRKCLSRMEDVSQQGRTVLFVSHNMSLVQSLCRRGIFLRDGWVSADGEVGKVVGTYLRTLEQAETVDLTQRRDRRGAGRSRLVAVEITSDGAGDSTLRTGAPAQFTFRFDRGVPRMSCAFEVFDHLGQAVTTFNTQHLAPDDSIDPECGSAFVCEVDQMLLLPGRYRVDVWLSGDNRMQDGVRAAKVFDVAAGQVCGRPVQSQKVVRVTMPHRWRIPDVA